MENQTLMQYFEWYLPNDGQHWNRLAADASHLADLGIKKIWMPPAFKGTSSNDVGYGIYDYFDLGEFDQKGTVRTKYGFKNDYLRAISVLKEHGIDPIADVVLNHKAAADGRESFQVVEVDPNDRRQVISEPYTIQGWTHFSFPGRQGTYNPFQWHWYHFTGTDYDAQAGKSGIYLIQGDNKGWAADDLVDDENGNYDYLMYADIDFKHPEVIENIYQWADWFLETTGVRGFRLDAIKHIDSYFMDNFIQDMYAKHGDDFYVFGEFWKSDEEANQQYLEKTNSHFDLVDVKLHFNFFQASQEKENYDLRTLFEGSLASNAPQSAVTFVDNHDTQRGQALESTIEEWFKPAAYAAILLRQEGLPCVFYGDYYGIQGRYSQESFQDIIDQLLYIRRDLAYGQQIDYLDDPNIIGWIRTGRDDQRPLVALLANQEGLSKEMEVGLEFAGQTFTNLIQEDETVTVDENGWARFPVNKGALSVWSII